MSYHIIDMSICFFFLEGIFSTAWCKTNLVSSHAYLVFSQAEVSTLTRSLSAEPKFVTSVACVSSSVVRTVLLNKPGDNLKILYVGLRSYCVYVCFANPCVFSFSSFFLFSLFAVPIYRFPYGRSSITRRRT